MDNTDFNPDEFIASAEPREPSAQVQGSNVSGLEPEAFDPDQFLADERKAKYGGLGQQVITGLESAAQGAIGPLAPLAERHILGVPRADILERREENPNTALAGELTGLVGSAVAGAGLGSVLEAGGQGAVKALGMAAPRTLVERVGSQAVKEATEMAILQSSNEVSKMVLQDPKTSAESAIANIGLAAALGGGGGAFMTGVASPIWTATGKGKLEKYLGGLKDHLDGVGMPIADEIVAAENTLGVKLPPEIKAANVSPKGAQYYNDLKSSQSGSIRNAEAQLSKDVADSISQSLGKRIEDFQNYDTAVAGREGMDAFTKEYRAKAEPISKEFNDLVKPFEDTPVIDSDIGDLSNSLVKMAQEKGYLGADIPQSKVVEGALNRLPNIKTAQDMKRLMTQVDNIASADYTLAPAARDVKNLIMDVQQDVLGRSIGAESPELFQRYVDVRKAYKDLAKISDEAASNLGIGKFTGPEGFLMKLQEKRSPEEFFKRLSPDGNAEILPFLAKHFPQTLEMIKDNELKRLIAPAIRAAKEGQAINVRTLNAAIEKKLAGQDAVARAFLPEGLIEKAKAGEYILSKAIPGIKDSGTSGWLERKLMGIPTGALGAVGWMTGHNPFSMAVVGALGEITHKKLPEAYKHAVLRFLASDQPIKADGFRAAVEYLENVVKADSKLNKAVGNIFKRGAQVMTSDEMPNENDKDTEKLDKMVDKFQDKPEELLNLSNGDAGHYYPDHQQRLTETAASQIQYLQALKPKPFKPSPLDSPIAPSKAEDARYKRALGVANNPMVVLQRIKDGTLLDTDIMDLRALYPGLYGVLSTKMSNELVNRVADEEPIPYKTRISLGQFLGQPLDSTMQPPNILAAQPKPTQEPMQPQGALNKSTSKLGKANKMHYTPGQAAEADRMDRGQ